MNAAPLFAAHLSGEMFTVIARQKRERKSVIQEDNYKSMMRNDMKHNNLKKFPNGVSNLAFSGCS